MEMLVLKKQEFVNIYQGCLNTLYGETYIVVTLSKANRIINVIGHIIEPNGIVHLIDDTKELVQSVREYLDLTYSVNVVVDQFSIVH